MIFHAIPKGQNKIESNKEGLLLVVADVDVVDVDLNPAGILAVVVVVVVVVVLLATSCSNSSRFFSWELFS